MGGRTVTEQSGAISPPARPIAYKSEVITGRGGGWAKGGGVVGGRPFVTVSGSVRERADGEDCRGPTFLLRYSLN